MIRLVRISLALSLALLGAPAFALTLQEVVARVEGRANVMNAVTEVQDAEVNLARVQRDPLAVRADLLQAEQRLGLAEAQLEQTRAATLAELVNAYTGLLGAERQLALAEKGLEVSERALEIATIRFESGSTTALETRDAQAAESEAESGVRSATEGRDLALNTLSGLLGERVEAGSLEGVPAGFFTAVPALEAVQASAQHHPDLLTLQQQAALAALATDVLDPLYAPQSEIESAASQLQNALTGVREAERGFSLQLQTLHAQAVSARETQALRSRDLAAAQTSLDTERQRLTGGLISQLEFEQAVLAAESAAAEAQGARVAYLSALLELQSGSLVPLGGPYSAVTHPAPGNRSAELTATEITSKTPTSTNARSGE